MSNRHNNECASTPPRPPSPPIRRRTPQRYSRSDSEEKLPRYRESSVRRRYRSRSRSNSRPRDIKRMTREQYSHSRSRSRSTSSSYRRNRNVRRSDSPSKGHSNRRRNIPSRPPKTRCLGVFGLNGSTSEDHIFDIFSKYGDIERINVVYDTKTGRSRGFCFVYYEHLDDAIHAKEALSGIEIDYRRIRVDYSITQRPHSPTPGVYKGNRIRAEQIKSQRNKDDDRRYRSSGGRRTPSVSPKRSRHNNRDRTSSRSS